MEFCCEVSFIKKNANKVLILSTDLVDRSLVWIAILQREFSVFCVLSCRKTVPLMAKKLDGDLTFFEGLRLKFHVRMCKFCRDLDKQMDAIDGGVRRLYREEVLDNSGPHLKNEARDRILAGLQQDGIG